MQQQQEQQQQEGSPLLRALRQLGDAAFSELLRPLLVELNTLALTCRELRGLCQRTQQQLRFRSTEAMTSGAAALVPECYSSCTKVELVVRGSEDVAEAVPALLPSLARLPALSSLGLRANDAASSSMGVGCVLRMVREQLPQLRQLNMQTSNAWTRDEFVWRTLGSITQLSSLEVRFSFSKETAGLQHTTALSGLVQLQHLAMQGGMRGADRQSHSYLASLGSLAHLDLQLVSTDGLAAIASCSNLRHLQLRAVLGAQTQLDEAVCAAFQQLVQLTGLYIEACCGTASPAFAAALAAMRQLEKLCLPQAAHATLAALAGATRLTSLSADWVAGDAAAVAAAVVRACASVRYVDLRGHGIPWQAFAGAQHIVQRTRDWAPAEFVSISAHCRQLTKLGWSVVDGSRVLPLAPAAERAAAIRSLAALGQLRELEWTPYDNMELAALAALSQLTSLEVRRRYFDDNDDNDNDDDEVTPAGVVRLLAGAQHLKEVVVDVRLLLQEQSISEADALAVLSACGHLQRLEVDGLWDDVYDVLTSAREAAEAAGLPMPADVRWTTCW